MYALYLAQHWDAWLNMKMCHVVIVQSYLVLEPFLQSFFCGDIHILQTKLLKFNFNQEIKLVYQVAFEPLDFMVVQRVHYQQ